MERRRRKGEQDAEEKKESDMFDDVGFSDDIFRQDVRTKKEATKVYP